MFTNAVPDPDLEIRGGAVIQTLRKGGGVSKNIFSALQASVSPGSTTGMAFKNEFFYVCLGKC